MTMDTRIAHEHKPVLLCAKSLSILSSTLESRVMEYGYSPVEMDYIYTTVRNSLFLGAEDAIEAIMDANSLDYRLMMTRII